MCTNHNNDKIRLSALRFPYPPCFLPHHLLHLSMNDLYLSPTHVESIICTHFVVSFGHWRRSSFLGRRRTRHGARGRQKNWQAQWKLWGWKSIAKTILFVATSSFKLCSCSVEGCDDAILKRGAKKVFSTKFVLPWWAVSCELHMPVAWKDGVVQCSLV